MRIVADHDGEYVIIVSIAFEGENAENLKAIYYTASGEIDADDAANFTVDDRKVRIP